MMLKPKWKRKAKGRYEAPFGTWRVGVEGSRSEWHWRLQSKKGVRASGVTYSRQQAFIAAIGALLGPDREFANKIIARDRLNG